MKKLSVLTAAFAAAVFTLAVNIAHAEKTNLAKPAHNAAEAGRSAAKAPAKVKSVKKKARSSGKTAKAKAASGKMAKAPKSKPAAAKGKVAYSTIIARYAAAYGVPAQLAHAVIKVESNYRVNAVGSAGEIGLMQIKPATARMMGYSGSAKGLFNPETNIKYGMKYLGMAHELGGGTTCGTILKYNAGHAAKRMNPVSSAYCGKVKVQMAGLDS
jgi:soluble lytic murein transglycosylase-like protein